MPLRNDILHGDYRSLYIAWLGSFNLENTEIDSDQTEPPVPYGLKKISSTLKGLIDFLEIDEHLIEIAAATSINIDTNEANNQIKLCLPKLPASERDAFLLQVLNGEPNVDKLLRKRLNEISNTETKKNFRNAGQRKMSQIEAEAKQLCQKRKAEKQRAKAEARIARLNAMAPQEQQIWTEVFTQINTKTGKGYVQATKLLGELKDLANHLGTTDQFVVKVKKILNDFSRYSALKTKIINQNII